MQNTARNHLFICCCPVRVTPHGDGSTPQARAAPKRYAKLLGRRHNAQTAGPGLSPKAYLRACFIRMSGRSRTPHNPLRDQHRPGRAHRSSPSAAPAEHFGGHPWSTCAWLQRPYVYRCMLPCPCGGGVQTNGDGKASLPLPCKNARGTRVSDGSGSGSCTERSSCHLPRGAEWDKWLHCSLDTLAGWWVSARGEPQGAPGA